MHIQHLIAKYGDLYYAIAFVWTFLEGETFILLSGIAAKKGLIDVRALTAVAWLGAWLGDQTYFAVGRIWGRRLLKRFPRVKPGIARALSLLERHSTLFVLTFRFVYGIRNVSSFAIGMSSMGWGRFAALNFVSAGIWAVAFVGAGYLAGGALKHVVGETAQDVSLGLLVGFVLIGGFLLHRAKKEERAAGELPVDTKNPS